ncbi:unnamed protein product [Bemisia tabaci]|uniref:Ig-like domain-containing protein n=1 Tax=Bemisia tabaci TaxID=7038 RepID=A0A9P0A0R8_BEMTA|nr:unnamed protein product [Bemisia tabaci]
MIADFQPLFQFLAEMTAAHRGGGSRRVGSRVARSHYLLAETANDGIQPRTLLATSRPLIIGQISPAPANGISTPGTVRAMPPAPKYAVEETRSSYKVNLRLTLRRISAADLGPYVCLSTNSLGRADGTVRLSADSAIEPEFKWKLIITQSSEKNFEMSIRTVCCK